MNIKSFDAALALNQFIDECDGDTLAAIYEHTFARIEHAHYDEDNDELVCEEIEGIGSDEHLPAHMRYQGTI